MHAQTGSTSGIVVDQTGKPIAGVHIRLILGDFSWDRADTVYGATSDAAGQFFVDSMTPGSYTVMAQRPGFVQQSPNHLTMLGLKPGQHLTDYKIVLAERALIIGHVLDENGDPVEGVRVLPQPASPSQIPAVTYREPVAVTDDRGEFRVIAAPGKYYLLAMGEQTRNMPVYFANTYYPSAVNKGAASAIEVAAGQDVAGIDIRLQRRGTRELFMMSGVVTGLPADRSAMVRLVSSERHYSSFISDPGGKFEVGIEPGEYSIAATYSQGQTPLASPSVNVSVEGGDQAGLVFALGPGRDLSGTLLVVGDTPSGSEEKRTVRLEATGWQGYDSERKASPVGADGSFRLASLWPATFTPIVEPMPENGYLKEVAVDGKVWPGGVLDFSQGVSGSQLKITVSCAGGQVSGRVIDKDGEPALGQVMVYFGTDAKQMDKNGAVRVIGGTYSFKAIRPGKYRLIALDVAEIARVLNPTGNEDELRQQLFDAAEEIEIEEDDRISKDIPVWTKFPEKKEPR